VFCLTGNINLLITDQANLANQEECLNDLLTRQSNEFSKLEKSNAVLLSKLGKEDTDDLTELMLERKTLVLEIENLDKQIKKILSEFKEKKSSFLNNNTLHLLHIVHNKAAEVNSSLSLINQIAQKVHGSFHIKLNELKRGNKVVGSYVLNNKKKTRYEFNG
jgi:hypothetical protein